MAKRAFEPRITPLRQRGTKLEEHAHHLADEAALPRALPRLIGRLEDVAAQVKDGLEEADWTNRRERIRALVKRGEVDDDQVHVVCRLDPRPGDPSPEKNSLHLCRGSTDPAWRCPGHRGDDRAVGLQHSGLEPLPHPSPPRAVLQAFRQHPEQPVVLEVGENPLDVRFAPDVVRPPLARDRQLIPCVQRPHLGPIPIAPAPAVLRVERGTEPRDCPVPPLVCPGGDPARAAVPVAFREIGPLDACGSGALPLQALDPVVNGRLERWLVRLSAAVIDARRRLLAEVAPARAAIRLLAPLVERAKPGLRLLWGRLRSPRHEG
jgi:hypothetical protein